MIARCIEPNCPELTSSGYCEQHRRVRSAHRAGYDWRWRRFAQRYLRGRQCEELDCFEPAVHVHHRDGKGPLGPLGFEPSNLEALCAVHHGERERRAC